MSDQKEPTLGSATPELRNQSLIFISHDSRDAELAEAFSKLLSSVSAGVLKSFRSSDRKGSQGIEYGVEWYPDIMRKLDTASDVVCLLTQRSLDRPWILYEAGVARGKLNTPVFGIALGIPLSAASSGPFAQFQNCDDTAENLTNLVMQLVRRIPGSEPDRESIQMQVKIFCEKAAVFFQSIPEASESIKNEETSVASLFEEVKVMFQDLPSRIEHRVMDAPKRLRRIRGFRPMMARHIPEVLELPDSDPLPFLVLADLVQDDLPWLAELYRETYRELKSPTVGRRFSAIAKRVYFLTERAVHSPMAEEFERSKSSFATLRELPMAVGALLERMARSQQDGKIVNPSNRDEDGDTESEGT